MDMSCGLHAQAALPLAKEPLVPMGRRLVGPQCRSGHGGEEKNSQPLPKIKPPLIRPVAQTELSWFLEVEDFMLKFCKEIRFFCSQFILDRIQWGIFVLEVLM
jgi:hypothetical protein